MVDRRALVVGSWLSKGREKPSAQRVKSIAERWNKIFQDGRYGYRSLSNKDGLPAPLFNPSRAELLQQLDNATDISADTELLLFFVGHSVSSGEHDIDLILSTDPSGMDRTVRLSRILEDVAASHIRRAVVILDSCHAGRTREVFNGRIDQCFAMMGAGDAYAFDTAFSDAVLRSFEQPIQRNDQRIDRRASGITYRKIFEEARRRVILTERGRAQNPTSFGNYGDQVVLDIPRVVPDGFNRFAPSRTIYGRVYRLLSLIAQGSETIEALRAAVRSDEIFLLKRDDDGNHRTLSADRLSSYLDFLRKAKWLIQPGGRMKLTGAGMEAARSENFNKSLLQAIQAEVLPDGINLDLLDEVVNELLVDMIPPTPVRIKDRLGMKGWVLRLDPATRVALQILPSSGRFLKGSADAIFPSELG